MRYRFLAQQVEELINKISKLELEIAYMEKYLLSLYRKTFEKRIPSSISRSDEEGSIRRCQSSLSHRFNGSISRQVLDDRPAEAYHSLPLSMLEVKFFISRDVLEGPINVMDEARKFHIIVMTNS